MGQSNQHAGQISAIDGGDVFRLQGPQVSRVVPIEDMTAKPLELFQSRERALQPLDTLDGPDPSEVARRSDREKIKTDVGRRGTVRDDRVGIFLKIVRRQEIVFLADEFFEEAPRSTGGEAQNFGVLRLY